jgi:hypothetical protein
MAFAVAGMMFKNISRENNFITLGKDAACTWKLEAGSLKVQYHTIIYNIQNPLMPIQRSSDLVLCVVQKLAWFVISSYVPKFQN